MSANRLLVLLAVITLVASASFTAQSVFSNTNSIASAKDSTIREYSLGERYGELPESSAIFSVEQIQREYVLGERYGVLPQEYTRQQTLREYWLGERYGQTP